ncbi:MAG TPA: hypothetical protein H9968_01920 [Candidatus Anaerobutyricum stercoris]|uniref:Mor transcription activator domain-containing protein n=1 Tax=Candidatus Anaerobutyricum stercoris TaxID=2838457 RepID=A0A9D2EJV0_9FIRM|nr:hypothetical protein [Candidatus Anaerobutyricum stercoris]
MKYINANVILPDELVEELQKYVQAGYIYVPAREEQHKAWGELSGYREELEKRNGKIISEYRQGSSVEELADRYSLSTSAIRKIIHQKKQKKNEESGRENKNCGKQS